MKTVIRNSMKVAGSALITGIALTAFAPSAAAFVVVPVPEPSTLGLIAGAVAVTVIVARFTRRK